MRKYLFLFCLFLKCFYAQGAQPPRQPIYTKPCLKEYGIIYFKDGSFCEYDNVHLGFYDHSHVRGDIGEDIFYFSHDEVDHVEVWKPDVPDCPHYYFYEVLINNRYNEFGCVRLANDRLLIVKVGDNYKIDEDGIMVISYTVNDNYFYKLATGESHTINCYTKKQIASLAEFFSDDPAIADYVLEKKVYFNSNYIMDNYSPQSGQLSVDPGL